MDKIFLIYYRNVSSMSMEIFELTDDNIKFNKPWPIDADVNYNPQRQMLYNDFICALVKRYGNQTIEDIPSLPLTRILDLARDERYVYNNGFYYICEADNPLELMHRFYTVMCKEEENDE